MGNILSSSSSSKNGKPKVSFACKMDYNVTQMHMNRFTVYVPWTYHFFPRLYNWHAQCTYNHPGHPRHRKPDNPDGYIQNPTPEEAVKYADNRGWLASRVFLPIFFAFLFIVAYLDIIKLTNMLNEMIDIIVQAEEEALNREARRISKQPLTEEKDLKRVRRDMYNERMERTGSIRHYGFKEDTTGITLALGGLFWLPQVAVVALVLGQWTVALVCILIAGILYWFNRYHYQTFVACSKVLGKYWTEQGGLKWMQKASWTISARVWELDSYECPERPPKHYSVTLEEGRIRIKARSDSFWDDPPRVDPPTCEEASQPILQLTPSRKLIRKKAVTPLRSSDVNETSPRKRYLRVRFDNLDSEQLGTDRPHRKRIFLVDDTAIESAGRSEEEKEEWFDAVEDLTEAPAADFNPHHISREDSGFMESSTGFSSSASSEDLEDIVFGQRCSSSSSLASICSVLSE